MPSTMIHLLVAHEIKPTAPDLFWVGNFAPDYTNDKDKKDKIHLRGSPDRWASLEKLYSDINKSNYFELGWFIHLFVDACWEEKHITDYYNWYISSNEKDNWFLSYREEIGFATYYLYHNLDWAKDIWNLIKCSQLNNINTSLPITITENEWYRDRVVRKHSESDTNQIPKFFTIDKIMDFSVSTANRYKEWIAMRSR